VREPSASVQAALLASCADRVGRFRDMHDLLFSTEEHVTVDRVLESLNISDEEGFARCVEDRTTMAALQGDFDGAVRLGVSGTPTAVYRGKMYVGASTIARLVEDWEHP
jgi:protein-disulfide isomerase